EDQPDRLRLFGNDDQLAILDVVPERRHAAHPHAFLLRRGDLVAHPLADHLALERANDSRMLRVSRPIEVVVLNCCVTATKVIPWRSSSSTILAKSISERVSRSTL